MKRWRIFDKDNSRCVITQVRCTLIYTICKWLSCLQNRLDYLFQVTALIVRKGARLKAFKVCPLAEVVVLELVLLNGFFTSLSLVGGAGNWVGVRHKQGENDEQGRFEKAFHLLEW